MKKSLRSFITAILMVVLALDSGMLSAPGPLKPGSSSPGDVALASGLSVLDPNTSSSRLVARLYFTTRAELEATAGLYDTWEAYPDKLYIVVALDAGEFNRLEQLGYQLEIDAEKTAKLNPLAPLDARFYYFDNDYINPNGLYIVDTLASLNSTYPNLVQLIDIGDAWQSSHGGHHRDLWVTRITNEDPAYGPISEKPAFFLFGTIHAREVAIPELALRYIKYLTTGFNGEGGYLLDADVTWLVNHHVIYVLVMQNPDGHRVNEQDISAYRRKNMDNDDGCSISSSWGTDLNRNHSFKWGCCGGSSGSPCDEIYRGPARASEPETQYFQNYFTTVMLDQNGANGDDTIPPAAPDDATGTFVTLHSYADEILWPFGFDPGGAPNDSQIETIGRKLAYYNGFNPTGFLYTVDGTTDDWAYGKFGIASFTFEVGPSFGTCADFFPPYGCIDGIDGMDRNFWAENKPAFAYLHKISRTPYITSYGPDSDGLMMTPAVIAPGEPTQISATIADHRYGGDTLQPIAAAEYFIDTEGEDGAGAAMTPGDGSWGGMNEAVQATLDTSGLTQGQHYILVHGQNTLGKWGPFTAIFLYVMEPGVAPVIEGYVRDAATNLPLAATVSAGAFTATTDPASGYYHMAVVAGAYDISVEASNHYPATAYDVTVSDYTTTRQDFYLDPLCTVFFDNVEAGNLGWTADAPWAITTEASNSPIHSWTDSPGGNYANNRNISLKSALFDLSGYTGVTLNFSHIYATEPSWDFGYVEYSTNGGTTWTTAKSYSGYGHTTWTEEEIAMPNLDGQSNVRLRFRFKSDTNVVADGWHVDDIRLSGGGPACIIQAPPTAEFASTSPVVLGDAMHFSNLVVGTPPFDFAWNFGDGAGTSTESDPTYTYSSTGVFTVTLMVTNTLGSDSITRPVAVTATSCEPFTQVDLGLEGAGPFDPNEPVAFNAVLSPFFATNPYTYTLSLGDASPPLTATGTTNPLIFNHTYTASGTYPVEIAVWNCSATVVTDTLAVTIQQPDVELTAVALSQTTPGPAYAGSLVQFGADILPDNATKPYTYTLDFGDGSTPTAATSSADPLIFDHTYAAAGAYTLTISAWNAVMTAALTDTLPVTVEPPIVAIASVALSQVTTGTVYVDDLVDFSADLLPDDSDKPFTYTIDYGDETTSVTAISSADPLALSHTYTATGAYTLTVAAWNAGMDLPVSDALTLTVYASGVCVPLTSVTIAGPAAGGPAVYTFMVSYAPSDATLPIAFEWDNGDTGPESVRTLAVGEQVISVTAANCTVVVSDSHTISVKYLVSLPFLVR